MDWEMSVTAPGEEGEEEFNLQVAGSGDVDVANRRSRITLNMKNPLLEEAGGAPEADTTIYFINDTIYVQVFETWLKQEVSKASSRGLPSWTAATRSARSW